MRASNSQPLPKNTRGPHFFEREYSDTHSAIIQEGLGQEDTQTLHFTLKKEIRELSRVVATFNLKNANSFSEYFLSLTTQCDFSALSDPQLEALQEKVTETIKTLQGGSTASSIPQSPGELSEFCCQFLIRFRDMGVPLPWLKDFDQWIAISSNDLRTQHFRPSIKGLLNRGKRTTETKIVDDAVREVFKEDNISTTTLETLHEKIVAWNAMKAKKIFQSTRVFQMKFLQYCTLDELFRLQPVNLKTDSNVHSSENGMA